MLLRRNEQNNSSEKFKQIIQVRVGITSQRGGKAKDLQDYGYIQI